MAGVTIWRARRVGDRILCGRQVPPGGPYTCMGEIALVVRDWGKKEHLRPRPELFAEWPHGVDGAVYRVKTRVRFPESRAARRRSVDTDAPLRKSFPSAGGGVNDNFWAPCSHGGHWNRVGRDPDEDTLPPPL